MTEKLVGTALSKEDANHSFNNENNLEMPITHKKKMTEMLARLRQREAPKRRLIISNTHRKWT